MCGDGCLQVVDKSETQNHKGGVMCGGVDDGFCDGVAGMGAVPLEMAQKIMAARQADQDAGIDQVPVSDEVAKMVEEGKWRNQPH